jgi:hypothetical protein
VVELSMLLVMVRRPTYNQADHLTAPHIVDLLHGTMDPTAAAQAPGSNQLLLPPTFTVHPSFSPLHPPSTQHNVLVLANLATLSSCFSGALAGVLGLKNVQGFILYAVASMLNAGMISVIKCRSPSTGSKTGGQSSAGRIDVKRYVAAAHDPTGATIPRGTKAVLRTAWSLTGMGQDTLLTFLLFWIGFYVSF